MERMKSSIVPILLIVVFGIAFAAGIKSLNARNGSTSIEASELDFAPDTSAAFARAMKEDKVVMVKYGAEWCGPCKIMKSEAFPDGRVEAALSGAIVVDIDVDSPGADAGWLRGHDAPALPTVAFYRADGTLIGQTVGYDDVESFVAEIEKILAKA